ncbi:MULTISPECIES: hemagglutinin repeat-containing protein [unclassified Pseudomonas]|uniref:hemagglutinin repeat-containing protein n=1 Tax=unclassified Pseudomonas TaxID=196821 RepID=UPI0015A12841|nr:MULTISPECIES: hemagglutinin repeat-containing protein [unclassified Pseudomonas]NWC95965.1 hemagglutinin repeat-containing protein [Pseudomonas sp. IPO3779]NWD20343.1 hemagglutinin repeat-containing protein [Pseudomonas sp. IPO3778]
MKKAVHLPPAALKPCQTLRWMVCGLVVVHYMQPAMAASGATVTVTLAASTPQGPVPAPGGATVSTQQGVPVVNIVAPNAAGLSHNQFLNYDVERQGLVLNNSTVAGPSQLAGQLGANPQFNGRDASLILNEVISRNSSSINGPQEIFGRAADYVLANPNGINVNGASFINTPRAAFVVGSPEFEDGRLARLTTVEARNELIVGDRGLSNMAGAIDLIAPRIDVTGSTDARGDLNVIMGFNQVAYDDRRVQQVRQPARPPVDAQLFGAMQAGRITIISTVDGAGVKVAAPLLAMADLTVTSAGDLDITGTTQAQSLIAKPTLLNSDNGDVRLQANDDLVLTATDVNGRNIEASAGGDLRLDAVTSSRKTEQREEWDTKFLFITTETYDKKTTETRLQQRGSTLTARADLTLKAGDNIELKASTASAGGTVQAEAGKNLRLSALNDSKETRETLNHRKNLWRGDYDKTEKIETARSSSLTSGGAMRLSSQQDLQVLGSEVVSQGDLTMDAGGKVDIGTTRVVQENWQKDYEGDLLSGSFFGENLKDERSEDLVVGSRVEANGTLRLRSENVAISGSQVVGMKDALLISTSGALSIDGAQNLVTSDKSVTDSKLFGLLKDQTRERKDTTTQVRSQVHSQSNLRLQSASDLNVTASEVSAQGRLELEAARDINLLAGQNLEKTLTETDRHGFSASAGETKETAPGIKGSEQYQAGVNYTQQQTTTTEDTLTHEGSQLSGGSVDITAGEKLLVKGSDVTATDGDLNLAAQSIDVLSEADNNRRVVEENSLSLGQFYTGGMDRAGGGWQVDKDKAVTTTDTRTVQSSHLTAAGNLNLNAGDGQGQLVTEAAKVKAGGELNISAGSLENRAVYDSTVETREVDHWSLSVGANLEYKDVTRPIKKVVDGIDQTKVYQPSVLDALDPPNLGIDLAVNVLDSRAESGATTAVVSEFEGGAININVDGALTDTGTRYVATDGTLAISAGSHTFAAAENTTFSRDKGTDVDTALRAYTTTGSDINARILGSGGSFDLRQATGTAVPGSLEGKYGIQVQLGTDGRYEGTRMDAGQGDLKIRTPGSLRFTEARDWQTSDETTLGGFGWVEAGTSPDTLKKANAGGQLDKAWLEVEDTQGREARLFAEGLTEIIAGQDLTLQGTQIGSAERDSGEVRLKAGGDVEFLAGVDTHSATGGNLGGGARVSVKATQSDTASGTSGGFGIQGGVGRIDERSTLQRGGSLDSRGTVQIEGRNVRLQGVQGKARAFELAATGGELILESAVSDAQRDNQSLTAGLGASLTRSSESSGNGSGLFARAKGGIDQLDSQTHDNTRLQADRVQLDSRGDTRLLGATVTAGEVSGKVGGDLVVESRQDQVRQLTLNVDAQLTTEKNPAGGIDKASVAAGPLGSSLKDTSKKLYEKAADKTQALKDKVLAKSTDRPGASRDRFKDLLFQNPENRDVTPTLLADFSRTRNDTVAEASGIQGRDGVGVQVAGRVDLLGARIGSSDGAVDLGGASVTGKDLSGRDQRTDLGLNVSSSPLLLGQALYKEFTQERDPQSLADEQFNTGLLRIGGHDQNQLLTSGVDQKGR